MWSDHRNRCCAIDYKDSEINALSLILAKFRIASITIHGRCFEGGGASGKKLKLDEDTRWQIAGEAVEELRRYGGWKALDEEGPIRYPAPSSSGADKRESWKVKLE